MARHEIITKNTESKYTLLTLILLGKEEPTKIQMDS